MGCIGEVLVRVILMAAALLSLVVSAQAESVTYQVKAGKTASHEAYIFLPGCASYAQFRNKLLKQPGHGKLEIRPETFIATQPPCEGRKFVGTKYYYTPAKGFRGDDFLQIQIGYPVDSSGMLYTYTTYDVTLEVR